MSKIDIRKPWSLFGAPCFIEYQRYTKLLEICHLTSNAPHFLVKKNYELIS